MKIGRQWEDRLRIWSQQFEKYYVTPQGELVMSYFTTMEHLPYEQAVAGAYEAAPAGTKWGKKWEYGWFHTSFTVPAELEGERIVISLKTAEEMLVWVNGVERGAIDKQHKYITVTRNAVAGDKYDIYAECYAGHGPRQEGAGPAGIHEITVLEPAPYQVTLGTSFYGVWNEKLFQAAMDYQTLYQLVQKLPEKSLRAMKIIEGLKKFTYVADFELPEPLLTESVVEAAKGLQPLLECKNGSTAPDFTIFGQSHLDLAWLWPIEETLRKTARTYSNQLELMEEYEDYRFLMCEPPIIETLKELYPKVYDRVMEAFREGKFYPDGALWVECDTNIPSGESLIRQFVRGKRWFKNELNIDSKMAWMPDTFGFSAALPQIMKKCGIPYFSTQKLTRQDPEAEPFPYNLFWWEGMDGSRVLSHLHKKNNANFNAGDLVTRWEEDRVQQENIDGFMYPFGFGDGGGGPTREMLEIARRCEDLEGAPRCHMEAPERFFMRSLEHEIPEVYKGELYLAWHRGTLTSQAKTKRGIRKAEVTLKMAEFYMAQRRYQGCPIKKELREKLEELWTILLFNQFHDIAPGSSIHRVHKTAEEQLQKVISEGKELIQQILGANNRMAVYNHLGWERRYHGHVIPAQGWILMEETEAGDPKAVRGDAIGYEKDDGYILENRYLSCHIDRYGQLRSVRRMDIRGGVYNGNVPIAMADTEFLAGKGNRFLMYKDVNTCYDAWELGSMYENLPVEIDQTGWTITLCKEPDGVALLVEGILGQSSFSQKIFLGNEAERIDFITTVDWKERHKMLKVAFPVNVYTTEAVHEIQFGNVKRPTHKSKQSDKDKYEVCNHRYTALCDGAIGAAVLNDCKYGVSVAENEIRLTLLKAPLMPDMYADKETQEFIYSFYPFEGTLANSNVIKEATELNEPLILGTGHPVEGALLSQEVMSAPICLSQSKNVIVDTIKLSDTVNDALIVRVYEAMGQQTDALLLFGAKVQGGYETDMQENVRRMIMFMEETAEGCTAECHFEPYEIKTLLLYL